MSGLVKRGVSNAGSRTSFRRLEDGRAADPEPNGSAAPGLWIDAVDRLRRPARAIRFLARSGQRDRRTRERSRRV